MPEDRAITSQLYGGDNDTRIRQEIVLGIGGMRALEALGYKPTVFHMNEGHSAFLAIERIRLFIERQELTFEEALEATRVNNVFTTHTPVPAGIDLFDPGSGVSLLQQLLPAGEHRFRPLHGARTAQSAGRRRAAFHGDPGAEYVGLPQRRQPPASRGLAGDVARALAHAARLGNADHLRHQRRPPAQLDQRRSGRSLRSVSASPTGAIAGTIRPSGSRSATFPTKNCWKCIAGASGV